MYTKTARTQCALVDDASVVAIRKVAYPEARAALARGFREGLLPEKSYRGGRGA